VVIPTRNRETALKNLLSRIISQTLSPTEIIIVDSSDKKQSEYENFANSIAYVYTDIKSAAMQRNIGMAKVGADISVLIFLDDDTNPEPRYFEDIINTLLTCNAIGVSGLAINPEKKIRLKPNGFLGFLRRIFFLDSNRDGKLLISGVGIPVREKNIGIVEVEWLIGCSGWDFQKIKKLKFEEDFIGHSLGEDIIFSLRARNLGKLFVNSDIILEHMELPQANPNVVTHNYMWVYYRFRVSKYIKKKIMFYSGFYLSIFSKIVLAIAYVPIKPLTSIKQIVGLILGLKNIFTDIFKR
jgi:glycosyltransferase involved in cell wall biosynthesis